MVGERGNNQTEATLEDKITEDLILSTTAFETETKSSKKKN